jgi:hypothetical protein
MDAVVRRDTTFTLRLDAFDGNTSWQAHSRRVGRWTLLVQQYDMCHAIRLRGHKPLNRESAHRSSLPSCIDLQNGDAGRRKAGRPHPGVPRDRLRERPAERDHPVRGVPVFRVYGSRTPIGGMSMGAGQALNIGLSHLDSFAWIAAVAAAPNTKPVAELIPDSAAPKQLKLFWLGANNRDPLMRVSQGLHTFLTEKDVPHIWRLDGNAHDTAVMSANFYHFAQRLFKD